MTQNQAQPIYYDRLRAVNNLMRTTNIRGKEYAEVNQRILAFYYLFPDGRIVTYTDELTPERVDMTTYVYRSAEDQREDLPSATGHAFEDRKGTINATSYVENCETSAIGRALAALGIGIMGAVASADEVQNAIDLQESRTSGLECHEKPVAPKSDKLPAKAKKSPQKPPESPTDPTEAARLRLIDACNAYALARGLDAVQVMKDIAAREGFEASAEGFTKAAQMVEGWAQEAGVTYEKAEGNE